MHASSTPTLIHDAAHPSRGKEALDAIGMAPHFQGIRVHDAWASSLQSDSGHALCGVHLLRAWLFLWEQHHCQWASDLAGLLVRMKISAEHARAHQQWMVSADVLLPVLDDSDRLLADADRVHPPALSLPGTRGRSTQRAACHLLDRLLTRTAHILACLLDVQVPCDNHLAGLGVRMVNVQPKVSGIFRRVQAAATFCRIRGSLSTVRTQEKLLLEALLAPCAGQPPLPAF